MGIFGVGALAENIVFEISKECELESYCMTHPAIGFLLLLLYF